MYFPINVVKFGFAGRLNGLISGGKQWLSIGILLVSDYFAVVAALVSAEYCVYYFAGEVSNNLLLPVNYPYLYFIISAVYLAFLIYAGMYVKRLPFAKCVGIFFGISGYVSVLMVVLGYFAGELDSAARLFVAAAWLLSCVNVTLCRYIMKRLLVKSSLWQKPVVIVGAGKTAELLANRFSTEEGWGYVIRGLVEDNLEKSSLVKKYPCLGGFTQVEQIVIDSKVKEVIVAAPGLNREKLIDLVWRIQPYVSNVTIIPDLFGVPLSNMEVETLINERVVMLRVKNNLAFFHNKIIKKAFDLVAVITVFPVILIIILILMAIVKLDSKGTALYIGTRLGQKGKLFSCYKLRTMYENSDMRMADYFNSHPLAWKEWRKYSKLKEYDPRVTKVGKWLRKASLDELPQIFNVLRGEMSLVGPRPYLLCELEQMGFQARTILETVPGITGLWQVSGRNEIDFKGRLQMDSWYVRNWSVWQDIILLFKTMGVWLGRKGAY